MKIYDISQEIFGCEVYPGDPEPKREILCSTRDGALYNLTAFSMCAHNGTHIDAPYHFLPDGETVDRVALEKTVGPAYIAEHNGAVMASDAKRILELAGRTDAEASKRILIKGRAEVSLEAAREFADAGVYLIGGESQSVGPTDAPMAVHKTLLSAGCVLLEGIRLSEVSEGVYFLCAAPLSLSGSDGAPCRAVLIEGL